MTQDPRGLTSSSNGDLAFGGIRGYQSSYLVDGEDNNNAFFAQARGGYRAPYQFSNEVVQEFRVSSNTYGAELGRAGGAVINVVTKSGSNQLHGTDFYYLRDSAFGATQPLLDFKPRSATAAIRIYSRGVHCVATARFFLAGSTSTSSTSPRWCVFWMGVRKWFPQPGQQPLHDGDYEASDQALVFAAAARLSNLAGTYPSKMVGNAGFFKMDFTLTPHEALSTRLSTSRYSGLNNVFLDPVQPAHHQCHQRKWRRARGHRDRIGGVDQYIFLAADQPSARPVLARSARVEQQRHRPVDRSAQHH